MRIGPGTCRFPNLRARGVPRAAWPHRAPPGASGRAMVLQRDIYMLYGLKGERGDGKTRASSASRCARGALPRLRRLALGRDHPHAGIRHGPSGRGVGLDVCGRLRDQPSASGAEGASNTASITSMRTTVSGRSAAGRPFRPCAPPSSMASGPGRGARACSHLGAGATSLSVDARPPACAPEKARSLVSHS